MEYRVRLEAFEGPLDLLLHLIEKNQVDIYDIPVATITEQYLEYLAASEEVDLDHLADFVVMAATLMNIKARMLCPVPGETVRTTDEEEDDPREELVQRLLLYRVYKELAGYLALRHEGETARVYYREVMLGSTGEEEKVQARASLAELVRAFQSVWKDKEGREEHYLIPQGNIDIEQKMEELLQVLHRHAGGLVFQDAFLRVTGRREALAFFLALLELIRLGRVEASQDENFGRIILREKLQA